MTLKPELRKCRGRLSCRSDELLGGCLVTPQRAVIPTNSRFSCDFLLTLGLWGLEDLNPISYIFKHPCSYLRWPQRLPCLLPGLWMCQQPYFRSPEVQVPSRARQKPHPHYAGFVPTTGFDEPPDEVILGCGPWSAFYFSPSLTLMTLALKCPCGASRTTEHSSITQTAALGKSGPQ